MIVDIDEGRLDRELEACLAGLPPDPLEGEYIQAGPSVWEETLRELNAVPALKDMLVPAWRMSPKVQEGISNGGARILDRHFPGGLGNIDSWGPWAQLIGALAMLAFANFDFEHMTFRPMRPPPPPEVEPAADKPQPDKQEADRGNPGT